MNEFYVVEARGSGDLHLAVSAKQEAGWELCGSAYPVAVRTLSGHDVVWFQPMIRKSPRPLEVKTGQE